MCSFNQKCLCIRGGSSLKVFVLVLGIFSLGKRKEDEQPGDG